MSQFFEFTANGIRFKGFQDVRRELKQAWETTFGSELDDSPTSPDGHHIDLEAKTVNSVMEAIQVVTTMMNRDQASGVFLDYLAMLLGLERNEGETDDELRSRMDAATTTGYATYDGMLTYLQDFLGTSIALKVNDEPIMNEDGIPGHSFWVVIPNAVYEAIEAKVEAGEIANADDFVAQLIWNCKPAGIKPDGNKFGSAKDRAGLSHEVKFSMPTQVEIEISVSLNLYREEEFPEPGGIQAVKDAIAGWATGTGGWAKAEYIPGKDVIPERLYTPILTVSGIESAEIMIRKSGGVWSSNKIEISSQEIATISAIGVEVNT